MSRLNKHHNNNSKASKKTIPPKIVPLFLWGRGDLDSSGRKVIEISNILVETHFSYNILQEACAVVTRLPGDVRSRWIFKDTNCAFTSLVAVNFSGVRRGRDYVYSHGHCKVIIVYYRVAKAASKNPGKAFNYYLNDKLSPGKTTINRQSRCWTSKVCSRNKKGNISMNRLRSIPIDRKHKSLLSPKQQNRGLSNEPNSRISNDLNPALPTPYPPYPNSILVLSEINPLPEKKTPDCPAASAHGSKNRDSNGWKL